MSDPPPRLPIPIRHKLTLSPQRLLSVVRPAVAQGLFITPPSFLDASATSREAEYTRQRLKEE
jgi:hypothetical protein